ncbi:hypothetical protein PISMIDRAFT_684466 [Pisolithus microcarpus 441]|uniref:Uncharacterized protein n=1 Tax=Pisolithus microcarpus 441 TaxID=765257 RepID=A0A0C9Z6W9_9AGAM|nr:hypothetical protein PISMIDRAFT_684466 [Pisolithus microcarpus 441]
MHTADLYMEGIPRGHLRTLADTQLPEDNKAAICRRFSLCSLTLKIHHPQNGSNDFCGV